MGSYWTVRGFISGFMKWSLWVQINTQRVLNVVEPQRNKIDNCDCEWRVVFAVDFTKQSIKVI